MISWKEYAYFIITEIFQHPRFPQRNATHKKPEVPSSSSDKGPDRVVIKTSLRSEGTGHNSKGITIIKSGEQSALLASRTVTLATDGGRSMLLALHCRLPLQQRTPPSRRQATPTEPRRNGCPPDKKLYNKETMMNWKVTCRPVGGPIVAAGPAGPVVCSRTPPTTRSDLLLLPSDVYLLGLFHHVLFTQLPLTIRDNINASWFKCDITLLFLYLNLRLPQKMKLCFKTVVKTHRPRDCQRWSCIPFDFARYSPMPGRRGSRPK